MSVPARMIGVALALTLPAIVLRAQPGAQAPTRLPGTPGEAIFALTRRTAALEQQVKALQQQLADVKARQDTQPAFRTLAPFEVVDRQGRTILRVSDEPGGATRAADAPRVAIGRGSADNYIVMVRSAAGVALASFGETRDGYGNASVSSSDGTVKARMAAVDGFVGYGKPDVAAVNLTWMPSGSGALRLGNAAGDAIVEAGMTADGKGILRAFPVTNKTPIPVPSFIIGATVK